MEEMSRAGMGRGAVAREVEEGIPSSQHMDVFVTLPNLSPLADAPQSQSTDTRLWEGKYSVYCRASQQRSGETSLRPIPTWSLSSGFF